ncbi:MAG: hypothetical protein AB7P04_06490 [Bacteriovoracia bacterium]
MIQRLGVFFAFLLASVLGSAAAHAYPSMIRHGYKMCSTCHVALRGGGLLTDYGRGVGGSGSVFPVDYKPSESEFSKTLTANGTFIHGLQFRMMGMNMRSTTSIFPMQLDYLNSTKLSEKLRFEATAGLTPDRATAATVSFKFSDFVLRRAIVAYREEDKFEVSAGRDFIPAGLNIDDHTSYIRSRNRRNTTDFVTTVRADLWNENLQVTPFVYLPSYQEAATNRESGGGVRGEYFVTDHVSVGGFGLFGDTELITRRYFGVFTRLSTDRYGLLAELDLTQRNVKSLSSGYFNQTVIYARPFFAVTEWLEMGWPVESLSVGAPFAETGQQHGPDMYVRFTHITSLIGNFRFTKRGTVSENLFFAQVLVNL